MEDESNGRSRAASGEPGARDTSTLRLYTCQLAKRL